MLDEKTESELIHFLRDNNDIFALSAKDLWGVDRSIIEYTLEVNQNLPLVKKKLHKMSKERKQIAKAEVQRLLDAGSSTS